MAETLYATFKDPNRARTVADELLHKGVRPEEITLFVRDDSRTHESAQGVDLEDTRPTTPLAGTDFHHSFDPMGNDLRQLSVPRIEKGLDVELNPAQDDYPRTGAPTPTELSSAPPAAERDYNRGLESDRYNKDYVDNVQEDLNRDAGLDAERRKEAAEATPHEDMPANDSIRFSRGYNALAPGSPPDMKVDPDAEGYRDADTDLKHNVTGKGIAGSAAHGAEAGFVVGTAAALAVLLIPGLGLVIGAGPLAAALTAIVAGTGTGVVAGGLAGFLREHGVPESSAAQLSQVHESGGAVLGVTIAREEMRGIIHDILQNHGAEHLETHQAYLS